MTWKYLLSHETQQDRTEDFSSKDRDETVQQIGGQADRHESPFA